MTRALPVLMALALLAPGAARGEESPQGADSSSIEKEAQTEPVAQSRLEQKIAPVSGNLFFKEGRLEVSPTLGLSVADAFFQKYSVGAKLGYHFSESWSVGGHISYAFNTPAGTVSVCRGECRAPTLEDMTEVPGRIGLLGGVEVGFAPIYGKLNVLAEKVLHFDLGLVAGVSAVEYQAPGGKRAIAPAAHLGLGQRYSLSRSVTLRIELRDYIYNARITQLGTTNRKIENQLLLELGLSFFFGAGPTS